MLDGLSSIPTAMLAERKTSTRKLSFIGVMTALCVSTNYLLIGLVNVKFMDLFVFTSGLLAGNFSGIAVACLSWLVYGNLNPYGWNLPTLAATCIGESFYGIAGGISANVGLTSPATGSVTVTERKFWESNLKIGVVGFLLTFAYDMFTNIVTGLVFEVPLLLYILSGLPFTLVHEVSNFVFFFLGGNVLINAIRNMGHMGGRF